MFSDSRMSRLAAHDFFSAHEENVRSLVIRITYTLFNIFFLLFVDSNTSSFSFISFAHRITTMDWSLLDRCQVYILLKKFQLISTRNVYSSMRSLRYKQVYESLNREKTHLTHRRAQTCKEVKSKDTFRYVVLERIPNCLNPLRNLLRVAGEVRCNKCPA